MEAGCMKSVTLTHGEYVAYTVYWETIKLAEKWLAAHPRGHIDLLPDERGYIVSLSAVDPATGFDIDAATGCGETLLAALVAALKEGEQ